MAGKRRFTRRGFLRTAGTAAVGVPYVLTSEALAGPGRPAASDRIVMGFIGVGGQGGGHVRGISGRRDVQILAVCDVDEGHRLRAKKDVEDRYTRDKRPAGGVVAYHDFRELLARDEIDAILTAPPDHWHALVSVAAAKAGKDIYCEKPLASSIAEGRAVADAVRRYQRVFQTGSQERSGRARIACELVRNGRIGKLHTIRTYLPTDGRQTGNHAPQPVPDGFDYDFWLGRAPWAPYTSARCHFNFRWIRDYSPGELTDRGAHVNDIALWGAEPQLVGPVKVRGKGQFPKNGLWNSAIEYHIEYEYASGLRIITDSRLPDGRKPPRGIKFEGSDGWIFVHIHGGHLEAEPESVLKETIGENEIHLHRSPGHHEDWFRAIRSRGPTVAPADQGHRTASFCHLGNIAILLDRDLLWDPDHEEFPDDDEANRMVRPHMREPWTL